VERYIITVMNNQLIRWHYTVPDVQNMTTYVKQKIANTGNII